MKTFFTAMVFLGVFLAFSMASFADDAQKGDDKTTIGSPLTYLLKMKYPMGIHNVYKFNEQTIVRRQFSDSSVKEYKRDVSYFFLVKQLSSTEDGFLTLDVTIDSIKYKFIDGESVFEFDSQDEEKGFQNFDDLRANNVPLGRNFAITYSPYGDVVKIEGEDLDMLKGQINDPRNTQMDTVEKFLWLDGVSPSRLAYITDVKKINFPIGMAPLDTTWKTPISFQADGINFYDTATTKLSRGPENSLVIEGKFEKIRPVKIAGRYYGVNGHLLPVAESKGSGTFSLEIFKGIVKESQMSTVVESVVPVKSDKFTQKVTTKSSWELVKQYQY